MTRLDSGAAIDAAADLSRVPAAQEMSGLLQGCIRGEADDVQRRQFATLWQQRVQRILLEHWDDDTVFHFRVPATDTANP